MRFPRFRSVASSRNWLVICSLFLAGIRCSAAIPQAASPGAGQPQSRSQRLANPLNDLLNDAQHDIDTGNFQAAIAPLQKFIAEKPGVAYAHFQLAYAYTAL